MKTLHLQPIVPKYMKSFQCLGTECPQTCCTGWRVDVDEVTYKKYQKVNFYSLATKLQSVVKLAAQPSRSNFAVMEMQENGNCSFLDGRGLCEIHAQLGSGFLSDTCTHYPRVFSKINEKLYCFATMSCPGIAELALRDPDGLATSPIDMAIPGKSEVPVANFVDVKSHPDLVVEFLEPIYEVACMILRQPDLSTTEAMVVLSLMVQRIDRQLAEPDTVAARNGLVQALTDFCRPAYCLEVRAAMEQVPRQTNAKIALLKAIIVKYLGERNASPAFLDLLAQVSTGLRFASVEIADSESCYNDAESNWFEPFDAQHRHLLKNYLLNDLGKNNFPVGRTLNIEAEFMSLAVRFSLIKLFLVGIAGVKQESFSEQDYVCLVYTFVRNLEHGSFFADTLAAMEERGCNNLAAALLLLR